MFLRPILNSLRQSLYIKGNRNVRTLIKINKHKFLLSIDVRNFEKDEIRVKARPQYVIIEGKQERKTNTGYVIRKFVKKYKLPTGCDPETMKSTLSEEGILTIIAEREYCERNFPCESVIPISYSGPKEREDHDSFIKVENFASKNPCEAYLFPSKKSVDAKQAKPEEKPSEGGKKPKCP